MGAAEVLNVAADGGSLGGWIQGTGPPVLLLHGGPGLNYTYLDDLGAELAVEFRVASYQQRGLEPSTLEGPFTVAQSIEDALTAAKWKQVDCPSPLGMPRAGKPYMCKGANTTNVKIGVVVPPLPQVWLEDLSIPPSFADAGKALVAAVKAAGIEATFDESPKVLTGMVNPAMNVMIGPKE